MQQSTLPAYAVVKYLCFAERKSLYDLHVTCVARLVRLLPAKMLFHCRLGRRVCVADGTWSRRIPLMLAAIQLWPQQLFAIHADCSQRR